MAMRLASLMVFLMLFSLCLGNGNTSVTTTLPSLSEETTGETTSTIQPEIIGAVLPSEELLIKESVSKKDTAKNAYLLGRGSPDEPEKREFFANSTHAYEELLDIYAELADIARQKNDRQKEAEYLEYINETKWRIKEIEREIA
jgi:hypothetical protein